MNSKEKQEKTSKQDLENPEEMTNVQDEQPQTAEAENKSDKKAEEAEDYKKKYEELNDAHLRLRAEFDNYRKRTLKEKADLIKTGGESALKNLLPVTIGNILGGAVLAWLMWFVHLRGKKAA